MRHGPSKMHVILTILGVTAGIVVCWIAAYYLLQGAYTLSGWEPSPFTSGLLSNLLGIYLMMNVMFLVGKRTRNRQMAFFFQVIEAIRQIAKGDFNIKLARGRQMGEFGMIVDSIEHMAQELQQMEVLRQEFISNVSHEFQSPLTSINGFAQALQGEDVSAEERLYYSRIIEAECKRLSKLSDNLLKLTSLQSQHHPFEPKRYRLDRQLRQLVLACEPQWLGKEIEMEVSLDEAVVLADEEMMSQVWINLLHNAIKFTHRGGTIAVHVTRLGADRIEVRIADNGIGIPQEDQTRIFERFFKSDASRNRENGGSGLGLSIVKNIVDRHQAHIRVESAPNLGTAFIITLPAAS